MTTDCNDRVWITTGDGLLRFDITGSGYTHVSVYVGEPCQIHDSVTHTWY